MCDYDSDFDVKTDEKGEEDGVKTAQNKRAGLTFALVVKWRREATFLMKANTGPMGCLPCEKIMRAGVLRKCAKELKAKIK